MSSKKHFGNLIIDKNDFKVIDCEKCMCVHKIPVPSKEELKAYYEADFYEEKNTYLEYTEKDKTYRDILNGDKLENLSLLKKKSADKSILDIGSSGGNFVEFFSDAGWNCVGVEPSKQAHEFAISRNRNSINSTIEDYLENCDQKFDVIHMREVIDTIVDPLSFIKLLKEKLLKEKGILIIDTSNEFNDLQKCMIKTYGIDEWWTGGDTINYFNLPDLKKIMKEAGLNVVHYEATFPLEIFALMGDNYIGNNDLGKQFHQKRVQFETNLKNSGMNFTKRKLYNALAECGIGRNIVIYGENQNE